jgi:hypothetical protein
MQKLFWKGRNIDQSSQNTDLGDLMDLEENEIPLSSLKSPKNPCFDYVAKVSTTFIHSSAILPFLLVTNSRGT